MYYSVTHIKDFLHHYNKDQAAKLIVFTNILEKDDCGTLNERI